MKNWTIGKKITVGFAALNIIAMTFGLFAYFRLSAISVRSDQINKQTLPTLQMVYSIRRNVVTEGKLIYAHIGSSDKEEMAQFEDNIKSIGIENEKLLGELSKL